MDPRFLVLTEDTSSAAVAALQALVTKMLLLIDPRIDPSRIAFIRYASEDERARRAMDWNGWKGKKGGGHQKRVDLIQTLATRLERPEPVFVLVLVDGDRPFADSQNGTPGENPEQFEKLITPGVRLLLQRKQQPEREARLMLLVPYHSVESWYFQNFEEALRICAERNLAPTIGERFTRWRENPGLLDEAAAAPKDEVKAFGGDHNERLARNGYPAARVLALGKSFAVTVHRLLDNRELVAALETLHRGQGPSPT